jgi:hypothetical protein
MEMEITGYYDITLKNGEKRKVFVLKKYHFACFFKGDATRHFRTHGEIKENDLIEVTDLTNPMKLYEEYCGCIQDEGILFEIYQGLRNPIIKLEFIEEKPLIVDTKYSEVDICKCMDYYGRTYISKGFKYCNTCDKRKR